MLYPQSNKFRSTTSLNGIWNYKLVEDDYIPLNKAEKTFPMAVPASINDIVTDKRIADYAGKVLFETEFSLPQEKDKIYRLRIGSASHKCEIYLNGTKIGDGINGHLPIDLPLENLKDENRLSVIIDNRLDFHTLPMGMLKEGNVFREATANAGFFIMDEPEKHPKYKQVINHDFYNFTGIHRDVIVYGINKCAFSDITVKTVVGGDYNKISVKLDFFNDDLKLDDIKIKISRDEKAVVEKELKISDLQNCETALNIENPELWSPESPVLYKLTVESSTDKYSLMFGIRKVSYDKKGLYLNDKPVYLKGFGMHEDFFISGKGINSAVNVRNFELLKWINANSFRTSHYPYAEEIYDLADRYGILVIDEVPAVGVNHWPDYTFGEGRADEKTLALHKELLSLLWERDKNHPSVVMISVANEAATYEDKARDYFKEVVAHTRTLTDLPVTSPEETKFNEDNKCADLFDFISLNRYYGWYDEIGNIGAIEPLYKADLGQYYEKFRKPIIVTEFGADTVEGIHSLYSIAFSEEYQCEYLTECCRVFDNMPYVVGEHVWNFADFKTKEGTLRVRGNRKGVFTKEREPKAAAFLLKKRWEKDIKK